LLLPVGKLAIARYRIVSGRGKKVTIEIAGSDPRPMAASLSILGISTSKIDLFGRPGVTGFTYF